jgi:hypothetical protein
MLAIVTAVSFLLMMMLSLKNVCLFGLFTLLKEVENKRWSRKPKRKVCHIIIFVFLASESP